MGKLHALNSFEQSHVTLLAKKNKTRINFYYITKIAVIGSLLNTKYYSWKIS